MGILTTHLQKVVWPHLHPLSLHTLYSNIHAGWRHNWTSRYLSLLLSYRSPSPTSPSTPISSPDSSLGTCYHQQTTPPSGCWAPWPRSRISWLLSVHLEQWHVHQMLILKPQLKLHAVQADFQYHSPHLALPSHYFCVFIHWLLHVHRKASHFQLIICVIWWSNFINHISK